MPKKWDQKVLSDILYTKEAIRARHMYVSPCRKKKKLRVFECRQGGITNIYCREINERSRAIHERISCQ